MFWRSRVRRATAQDRPVAPDQRFDLVANDSESVGHEQSCPREPQPPSPATCAASPDSADAACRGTVRRKRRLGDSAATPGAAPTPTGSRIRGIIDAVVTTWRGSIGLQSRTRYGQPEEQVVEDLDGGEELVRSTAGPRC